MSIESNTFAEACYDTNSIVELEQALKYGPDATDMKTWGLNESEWTASVKAALAELKDDAE